MLYFINNPGVPLSPPTSLQSSLCTSACVKAIVVHRSRSRLEVEWRRVITRAQKSKSIISDSAAVYRNHRRVYQSMEVEHIKVINQRTAGNYTVTAAVLFGKRFVQTTALLSDVFPKLWANWLVLITENSPGQCKHGFIRIVIIVLLSPHKQRCRKLDCFFFLYRNLFF